MNDSNEFSPRAFLKARRPERFSDSVVEHQSTLDRTILEYHLDKLTSRSQELDFQIFARRLAEKTICPNLLPQTGPTGGGDSKVDSETYPVADDLSIAWYIGIGREAAEERWAFAISSKKTWRSKVLSDVKKIADTNRGYTKAFFITNQFVRDRDRAEVEDALRNKYGLDVRILDRTWILDKVFEGQHESLAIEDLRLPQSMRTQIKKGPLDLEREQALIEAEKKIQEACGEGHFGHQFVEDCIDAACLSRSQERPRIETDGRFVRAERAATQHGSNHQQLRCRYEFAWTACFWHEDFGLAAQLYGIVEEKAKGSDNAYDLELLSNLWKVLFSIVKAGKLDPAVADLDARSQTLFNELERLSSERERPSSSLYSRSIYLIMQLLVPPPEGIERVLQQLRDLVLESKGLVGFPFSPLVESLTSVEGAFEKYSSFDDLHDTIVAVVSSREGEIAASKLLLHRGARHLEADRPVDAVRMLGRTLAKLFKHESRHELVKALSLCGAAYEQLGLLWAARGATLAAAAIATSEFWTYADVTVAQAVSYRCMKRLELRLGRLPHVLAWHEIDLAARQTLAKQGYELDRDNQNNAIFNLFLAILFLKSDLEKLRALSRLPDVLDDLSLIVSADALRYALGYEVEIPHDSSSPTSNGSEALTFFLNLRNQPAARQLTAPLSLCDTQIVLLESAVLGCRITVECDNRRSCIALAESILAALESLLASGLVDRIASRDPRLTMRVSNSDLRGEIMAFELHETDGRPHIKVACIEFDPHKMSPENQSQARLLLCELLGVILERVFAFADYEECLNRLFGEDRAMERAVAFSSSFIVLGNVLGQVPRIEMSKWVNPSARDYPLTREKPWDADQPAICSSMQPDSIDPDPVSKERYFEQVRSGQVRHSNIETISLIREKYWQDAKWSGNAFLCYPGEIPVLAPLFRNAEPASRIFAAWRAELGAVDEADTLRVAIVRGIRRDRPYWYRVVFGANPLSSSESAELRMLVVMARVLTMEPTSGVNLSQFLDCYQRTGRYLLAYCVLGDNNEPDVRVEASIEKLHLHVRNAWQIGLDDIDCAGILPTDDPFIPEDQPNAPILELIRLKRKSAGMN